MPILHRPRFRNGKTMESVVLFMLDKHNVTSLVYTPWAAEHDSLDSSQMEYHIKRHHHNNTFLANQFDTLQGLVEGMRPLWLGLS